MTNLNASSWPTQTLLQPKWLKNGHPCWTLKRCLVGHEPVFKGSDRSAERHMWPWPAHSKAKCGAWTSNLYLCPYLCIYIYAVKLLSGPSLAILGVIIWASGVIIWAKLFLAFKNSGFKRFLAHTVIILCFCCAQISDNCLKIAFLKKGCKKIGFFNFLCFNLKFWNFSFSGLLKHCKNSGFS